MFYYIAIIATFVANHAGANAYCDPDLTMCWVEPDLSHAPMVKTHEHTSSIPASPLERDGMTCTAPRDIGGGQTVRTCEPPHHNRLYAKTSSHPRFQSH